MCAKGLSGGLRLVVFAGLFKEGREDALSKGKYLGQFYLQLMLSMNEYWSIQVVIECKYVQSTSYYSKRNRRLKCRKSPSTGPTPQFLFLSLQIASFSSKKKIPFLHFCQMNCMGIALANYFKASLFQQVTRYSN